MSDKIEYMGNLYPERRNGEADAQEGMVYNPNGISPSIVATPYKGTMPKIMTETKMENDNKVIEVGGLKGGFGWDCHKQDRVYSADGVCPALTTMQGGGQEPKILTPTRTEYGKQVRKDYENGELQERWGNMKELTPREDGLTNTLTSVQKDNLVLEKKPKYRIRRLTERECFRLMDVEEADIDKIQASGISGTQQYKMAGNSVVTACWYHIMRKLFVEKENEEQQLSLF